MARVEHTGISDEERIYQILENEGYFNIFTWQDSAGTRYREHTHPHDEVRWIISGELHITENGVTLRLHPGDKMSSRADIPHSAYVPEDVRYVCGSR
jgi:quercetin dioxygenase-like cupin family protein